MPVIEIKGNTFDKVINRLKENISAKEIAKAARVKVTQNTTDASRTLGRLVKQENIDKNTSRLYIEEKMLVMPQTVPGNKKNSPISSNLLATYIDEDTKPHQISPLTSSYRQGGKWTNTIVGTLHFFIGRKEIFTRKTINHPGTKGKRFWGNKENVLNAINKFIKSKLFG